MSGRTNDAYRSCKIRYRLEKVVFGENKLQYVGSHWAGVTRGMCTNYHYITKLRSSIIMQNFYDFLYRLLASLSIVLSTTNRCDVLWLWSPWSTCLLQAAIMFTLLSPTPWRILDRFFLTPTFKHFVMISHYDQVTMMQRSF